jgi:hypothetical protein
MRFTVFFSMGVIHTSDLEVAIFSLHKKIVLQFAVSGAARKLVKYEIAQPKSDVKMHLNLNFNINSGFGYRVVVTTPLSSEVTNGPNKLECRSLSTLSGVS